MERRPTRIRTTLALSMLALTLVAPGAFGQDPDTITEIRRRAEQGDADARLTLGSMYANGEGVLQDEAEAVRGVLKDAVLVPGVGLGGRHS